jgi:predicted enzyme related to lactoylglutathione lyase
MGQPVAMFEVVSSNLERAQQFYSTLFDWKVDADPSMGGYGVVDTGVEGSVIGGIGPSMAPGEHRKPAILTRQLSRLDESPSAELLGAVKVGGEIVDPHVHLDSGVAGRHRRADTADHGTLHTRVDHAVAPH